MGFIGNGTYGAVYGSPRLPCEGETFDEIKDLYEVSKVFMEYKDYEVEANVIFRIKSYVSEDLMNILKESFVFPIGWGMINYEKIPIEHYSDTWLEEGSLIWKGDVLYIRNSPILYQTIQPRGEMTLKTYYQKELLNKPFHKGLYTFLNTLGNILNLSQGLLVLHRCSFIHSDIKLQNTVFIDNTFKFIDTGDIFHTQDLSEYFDYEKLNLMSDHFSYWVYIPFIYWVKQFSIRGKRKTKYSSFVRDVISEFNVFKNRMEQIYPLYVYIYEHNILGLEDDELERIHSTLLQIIKVETCGLYVNKEHFEKLNKDKIQKIFEEDGTEDDLKLKEQVIEFYTAGEKFYGKTSLKKRDRLLKSNDCHGFGFMLATIFIELFYTVDDIKFLKKYFNKHKQIREVVLCLIDFIHCFILGENVFEQFNEFIIKLISPILETVKTQ
jgi:hypothetical protein